MLTSEVSMTNVTKKFDKWKAESEIGEMVNLELLKRYNSQLVSQTIINKMKKVKTKVQESEVKPPSNGISPQSPKDLTQPSGTFKRPYAVSVGTKSATKLSKQAQNELWYEINNTSAEKQQKNNTAGKQQMDNASKIQETNNPPKINHFERKPQINDNAEKQGDNS